MVGIGGFEPPTLRLSVVRSDQLSYIPINKAQAFSKEAGIQPAIFPWKGNVLALDYSSKRSLL